MDVTGIQASFTLGSINLIQTTTESPTGLQAALTLGQHAEIPGQIIGASGLQMTSSLVSVSQSRSCSQINLCPCIINS